MEAFVETLAPPLCAATIATRTAACALSTGG
jgi:hypothetical protein